MIWVLGGDVAADGSEEVWRKVAHGIAIGATGSHSYDSTLMSYHPPARGGRRRARRAADPLAERARRVLRDRQLAEEYTYRFLAAAHA